MKWAVVATVAIFFCSLLAERHMKQKHELNLERLKIERVKQENERLRILRSVAS